ncbi:hypothetical protein M422DRAFT_261476 [Sphaerobolus stellatus SS14]|uniref:Unplaced genomic scaffold SPHSTscaffold_106, whole genome shotgun sequence n=1 Tax=Sphaerobolus stellatus (strain SS14) TaxID=990650 RepID=A0A0C9UMS2_SPHS4|nr:hypothetical protein M422DRAFT_261476 [Sphaerobolus stellatus SS14]
MSQHNRHIKAGTGSCKKGFEVWWTTVTAKEAQEDQVEMSAMCATVKLPWKSLDLTPNQHSQLNDMYCLGSQIEDHLYSTFDGVQQNKANSVLTAHGLNETVIEDVTCRWSVKWAAMNGKGKQEERHTLYQCDCGCEHTQFGTKKWQTAYNYTECLAHAEVISLIKSGKIRRIHGYFVHNKACKKAVLSWIPPIPVHPSVYVAALKQLHEGASLTAIQARNRELFRTNGYPGQPSQDQLHNSQFQWIIKSYDTRALYQQYNRMIGVDTMKKPQINIDDWLDPQLRHYNATLAEAVFHYSPQAALNEHFEVCIATKEMKEMAWKYAHQSQMMVDGTFGIYDSKLLLFIVMVVDEKKKGVPLTFLLFSAPSGNKQISSSYDTAILMKLLQRWESSMEKFKSKSFDVLVAVPDMDLKEQGALLVMFPNLWLLICKFNICPSWRNHWNRVLKGKSPLLMQMQARLKQLKDALIQTMEFTTTKVLLLKNVRFS